MRYRTKHIVEYALLRTIAGLVSIMPYRLALSVGWLVAKLASVVMRKKMQHFKKRLESVFGDTHSEQEIKKILWLALRNFCFSGIELLRVPLTSTKRIKKTFAEMIKDPKGFFKGILKSGPKVPGWLAAIGIPVGVYWVSKAFGLSDKEFESGVKWFRDAFMEISVFKDSFEFIKKWTSDDQLTKVWGDISHYRW